MDLQSRRIYFNKNFILSFYLIFKSHVEYIVDVTSFQKKLLISIRYLIKRFIY